MNFGAGGNTPHLEFRQNCRGELVYESFFIFIDRGCRFQLINAVWINGPRSMDHWSNSLRPLV
jgi:hypothetical protein